MCSRSDVRLNGQISSQQQQKMSSSCTDDQRFDSAVCHTVFSCGLGTRINQLTINYVGQCVAVWEKLSVSLPLSLDLALVRLALLQSPLRMRLCSKGAAALLWLRGGGAGRSCSLWFIFQTPYGSYCMYLCSIRKIGHVWSSKDTIMSTWFFSLKMQAWWFQLLHVTQTQNITGMLSFTHIVQDYWLSFSTGSHAGYAGARHNKSSLVKLIQIQHFCHK